MDNEAVMRAALALALEGRGDVEPNPRVGAVAVQNGKVVGRGYHAYWGGPHAEVVALDDAEHRGALPDTLVVTLEPCSTGTGAAGKKTPACTERIKAARLRQVVVGAEDPDPRHFRKGVKALRRAGIHVVEGVLTRECIGLNQPYARWLELDRPWTIAKWAMSLDGKTAAASGDARWVSGEISRERAHQVRARVDGVVVGYRTVVADDPMLDVRHVEGANPQRIVVDPAAQLPSDCKLAQTAAEQPTLVLAGPSATDEDVRRLEDSGVTVLQVGGGDGDGDHHIDLAEAWLKLRRRGLSRLLVEGGGELTAQLFAAGCVDQVLAWVAPSVVGGREAPTPVGGSGADKVADALALEELYWRASGEDLELGAFVN